MAERNPLDKVAKWLTVHKSPDPISPATTRDAQIETAASTDRTESLPFVVRPAIIEQDIEEILNTRARAYGHHLPMFRNMFRHAEPLDFSPGTILLLAESKETKSILGSMRMCTNVHGRLEVTSHVTLPQDFTRRTLAEASRLSVPRGRQSLLVKLALWKAFFRICLAEQIDTMVVSAKSPVDRDYLMLGFQEIIPEGLWYQHSRFLNVNVHVMQFDVRAAERTWFEISHRLYDFMFVARHPDIQVTRCPFGELARFRENWESRTKTSDVDEPIEGLLQLNGRLGSTTT